MEFFTGLHGIFATVLLCILLYIDEAGVPLPLAPNEVLLIISGLLIAGHELDWFIIFPLAVVMINLGMITGYTWAHQVGSDQLRRAADRLGAVRAYDRAHRRMNNATPTAIGFTRCLPGVRVYATLVAGAAGVPLVRFLRGAVPASLVWTVVLMTLGVLVGEPAAHLLDRVDRVVFDGGVLLLLGLLSFIAARTAPRRRASENIFSPFEKMSHRLRLLFSLGMDFGVLTVIIAGVDLIVGAWLHVHVGLVPGQRYAQLIVAGATTFLYLIVSRITFGETAGERLFDISYVHPRRRHPRPSTEARRTDDTSGED